MNDKFFVDTKVLICSRNLSEPEKQKEASSWMTHLWETGRGRLSFQVLQEFYVTVTEKLRPGLVPPVARRDVRSLLAWDLVPLDARVVAGA